jgi:hypothetical protein
VILNPKEYTPSLRWRQGEYQALFFMSEELKDLICPLVTIPPVEFDFELQIPKKSPHEHIHPFAKRLNAKWGQRACWIDLHPTLREALMDDGRVTYDYIFQELRDYEANAVPVVSLDMATQTRAIICTIVETDQKGVGLRLRLIDLMDPATPAAVDAIIAEMGLTAAETDLLIDIEAPNYDPLNVFEMALMAQVNGLGDLRRFRNYSLIGTGFPESMAGIPKGNSTIPRQHWILYKQIVDALPDDARVPCFGDYTVTHPDFVALNMRLVKPSGKIIYTIQDAWHVEKGGSFRDDQQQMHTHSQNIQSNGVYRGAGYSFGDHFIEQCATHATGPSNLSRWKCVCVNHHMTTVLEDLATYHAGL